MDKGAFQIVAVIAAVALVAVVGLTFAARGDGPGERGQGFLRHLDRLGQRFHCGGRHHDPMAELHEQLMAQLKTGHVETTEIRIAIDEHVEQIREVARWPAAVL